MPSWKHRIGQGARLAAQDKPTGFVTGADIANMAVFLASEGARLVLGQVIAVDGHTVNPDPQV